MKNTKNNKLTKKYNQNEIFNIYNLIKEYKINIARKYLENYKEKYDKDHYITKRTEGILLAYEGNVEESVKSIKDTIDFYKNKNDLKIRIYYIYLLIEQEKYQEAYDLCNEIGFDKLENDEYIDIDRVERTKVYLEKKLGIKEERNYDLKYGASQIEDYSPNNARNHIYKKHNIDLRFSNTEVYSFFMKKYELYTLFYYINNALLISEKTFTFDIADYYYFRIKEVGYNISTNKTTDILLVVTNKNTKEIITMFPVKEIKNNSWVVNEEKKEEVKNTNNKVRTRTSQIDKFNNKYNL